MLLTGSRNHGGGGKEGSGDLGLHVGPAR
jgi:hypothetical protein